MSIQFYLQTRGKTIDYRFLYEAPSSDWWRYYADYTLFEDKTIILERLIDGKGGLYLSGIPSSRRDRVNTIIRYTLVAELGNGEVSEKAFQLVKQFLDDCREGVNVLGDKLDKDDCFPESYIEDALRYAERNNQERQDKINQKIASLFQSISDSDSYGEYRKDAWWGGLKSEESCKNWLSLANQILNGEPGVVALLNATSEKSLPNLKTKILKREAGIENIFILLPDNYSTPKFIKDTPKPRDISKAAGDVGKSIKSSLPELPNFFPVRARIYVGASVLVSALFFLVFMLVR